jgi:xylulokinase
MVEFLLGIDIGTSGSKGVLARPDGTIAARCQREHLLSLPRPGWAEHDTETVWWADALSIARELATAAAGEGRVVGVCVSGVGPCLLPTDAEGHPLRPAILYGIDTRAEFEIEDLTQ